jgi:L-alanine-DL-glutamate epimerase-like enolase superfamily enzyme
MGPFTSVGLATIMLADEDGQEGEAPITDLNSLENVLLPALLTGKRRHYVAIYESLYWRIRNAGYRGPAAGALGAIDLALHDLASRRAGLPLHRFLGAQTDHAPVYASGGGTNTTQAELEAEFAGYAEAGFTTVKMKVGRNFGRAIDEDIRRLRAVRSVIGPHVRLAVDANQIWTAAEAATFAHAITEFDVAWLEEPVHSADILSLRECCRGVSSRLAIAMGESESAPAVFALLVEAGVTHLQPIYQRLPSVAAFMHVRDLAEATAAEFSSGGYSHSSCQLIAAANRGTSEYLFAANDPLLPLLMIKPLLGGGNFTLPAAVGTSMRVAWDRVRRDGQLRREQSWTADDFQGYQLQV